MPYCVFLIDDYDHIVATERQFMCTAPFWSRWMPCPHDPLNKAISQLTKQYCPILSDGEHLGEQLRFLDYEGLMGWSEYLENFNNDLSNEIEEIP